MYTQKSKVLITAIALFGAMFFAVSLARAEEAATAEATINEAAQAVAESTALTNDSEVLEGVQITEPKNVPSGFGFWWNDLKERVSLVLTFDPVKKAEKQLQFAAQRVKLAEYMMANSTDAKVQEKAQQLLTRANEYTQKIEERKTELVKNVNQERVKTLLGNIAKNQMNLELALDKIEDKIPPERLEAFQQFRSQVEEKSQQFLEKLQNNSDIPQEVKDKALQIRARIETTLQDRETFRVQQKDILDEIKAGKEEAKAQLEALREERKQTIEQAQEQYKTAKKEILNRINSGEKEAVKELIQLNQGRKAARRAPPGGLFRRQVQIPGVQQRAGRRGGMVSAPIGQGGGAVCGDGQIPCGRQGGADDRLPSRQTRDGDYGPAALPCPEPAARRRRRRRDGRA